VRLRAGELTVRDHGPGITPADLPHVFDRFYRAVSARGVPGSGLGLAIVRQVAESHGGTVRAESVPGGRTAESAASGGTLIRLCLPDAEVAARASPDPGRSAERGSAATVGVPEPEYLHRR
jgi:two-component system sensor histidine kinase MprB